MSVLDDIEAPGEWMEAPIERFESKLFVHSETYDEWPGLTKRHIAIYDDGSWTVEFYNQGETTFIYELSDREVTKEVRELMENNE